MFLKPHLLISYSRPCMQVATKAQQDLDSFNKDTFSFWISLLAPTPCLLNMVSGGVTSIIDADETKAMGYKIVIWSCFAMTLTSLPGLP